MGRHGSATLHDPRRNRHDTSDGGMPDDLCQCPHCGYVLKGRIRIRKKDGEQIIMAGEIFYAEPGHVPFFEEDTTMVEFSPKEQWAAMTAMLAKNLSQLPKED